LVCSQGERREDFRTPPVRIPGDACWIGINIRRMRKRMNLTQEALAQAARITPRRLRDTEDAAEATNPTLKTLGAIAGVPSVETVELFKRHKEEGFEV
jgi:transcriptional regulator with XRE-family HTH domain